MYIYIWALLLSLLFASLISEVRINSKQDFYIRKYTGIRKFPEYLLLFLSMAPIILVSGLRYNVGADYFYTYTRIYDLVAQGLSYSEVNEIWNCEIGYYWLNKLVIMAGGGYVWIFTITSAIIIALFWIAFYEQSQNLCLSIAMFVCAETFFISLNYVRQFIALAIVFYALKFLQKDSIKDTIKYIICVIVAILFHKSALILLPWFAVRYIKLRPEALAGAVLAISLLKERIELVLIKVLHYTPYANYIGSRYQSTSRFYTSRPIGYIIVFVIARFLYKKCEEDNNYRFMLNTTALLILITVNFNVMPQLDRVVWYFEVILILFIPYLINHIENNWLRKVVTIGLFAMFSIFTYNNVVVQLAHGVIPYRLVFAPDMIFK